MSAGDQGGSGLERVSAGAGLSRGSGRDPLRNGLLLRGRRDAAAAGAHPSYLRGLDAYTGEDFIVAAASFRVAAEDGHAESQYLLSIMLEDAVGVAADPEEAAVWERRAAGQGHAYAAANLSFRCYSAGEYEEAFRWCERAAHSRLPWAEFQLGLMFLRGEGTSPSNESALRWFRLAAAQNFVEAQQQLAVMHYFGEGAEQDYDEAARWFRKAAEGGSAAAQFQLGHLYATGLGVELDYVQSRYWIRQAALQGHEEALQELKRRTYRDA